MTTNGRIEAARLTDDEIIAGAEQANDNSSTLLEVVRAVADAATAKAIQVEDARHQALRRKVREWAAMFARKAEKVGTEDCFEADLAKDMEAASRKVLPPPGRPRPRAKRSSR